MKERANEVAMMFADSYTEELADKRLFVENIG